MIRQIQYLRGIAAMMVVWHHATAQVAMAPVFGKIPTFGPLGVDLFFGISGFIMLVTTWDKPIGPAEFMAHRIKRIVPLYWLATLGLVFMTVLVPALLKSTKWDAGSLEKSLFFIPYYSVSFPDEIWPLLIPGWSLNYEMFFYVMFAAALLCKREHRLTVMVCSLTALVVAGWIFDPVSAVLRVYTSPRLLEFGAGMVLGRLWVRRKHARQDGGHAVLMGLGDASYSIYLSHVFTLALVRAIWNRLGIPVNVYTSSLWMLFALVACALAGWLLYLIVEKPTTRWMAKHRLIVRIEAIGQKT